MNTKIAASLLTADLTRLGDQVRQAIAAGVDAIHIDVMDGQFVPNLTFGPLIVAALRSITQPAGIPLDVHLMVETPERLIPEYAMAGADILTVHVETCPHLHRVVQQIKELGVQAGVTLNPATSLVTLEEILPDVDLVLVMTVNPGYGGQSYIPGGTAKIARLRQMLDYRGLSKIELEVDGGLKTGNVKEVAESGASMLVIGSAIFNQQASIGENVTALRRALGEAQEL